MTRSNTTFTSGKPTWANACVGENGFPGYWDYAKGFSQAADILINTILRDKGLGHSIDRLVYPVCFNMRHSVELRLKDAISELLLLGNFKGRTLHFDLAGSHDISNIWDYFLTEAQICDDRYASFIGRINRKIEDFAEIDATGQTFRYPLDTKNKMHLSDVTIINFVVLKISFTKLESELDNLHYFNRYLLNEYALGTFTKRLSRRNLFELANYLPARSNWNDETFGKAKNFIKQVFKIGSKELSEGIKYIETHYELAPLIGLSIPLLGVEEADIDEFLFYWFQFNGFPSDTDADTFNGNDWKKHATFEAVMEDAESQNKVWAVVQPGLTPEKLAGLWALYDLAKEPNFSEYYTPIYRDFLKESQVVFEDSERAIYTKYFETYDRISMASNILRSLYFLKKTEAAERLVVKYGLEKEYSWLDEARNRVLFAQSDYCGYTI